MLSADYNFFSLTTKVHTLTILYTLMKGSSSWIFSISSRSYGSNLEVMDQNTIIKDFVSSCQNLNTESEELSICHLKNRTLNL
jgi:hypothetical protein